MHKMVKTSGCYMYDLCDFTPTCFGSLLFVFLVEFTSAHAVHSSKVLSICQPCQSLARHCLHHRIRLEITFAHVLYAFL